MSNRTARYFAVLACLGAGAASTSVLLCSARTFLTNTAAEDNTAKTAAVFMIALHVCVDLRLSSDVLCGTKMGQVFVDIYASAKKAKNEMKKTQQQK